MSFEYVFFSSIAVTVIVHWSAIELLIVRFQFRDRKLIEKISLISCSKSALMTHEYVFFFSAHIFHAPATVEKSSVIRTLTETECYDRMEQNKAFIYLFRRCLLLLLLACLCEAQAQKSERRAHRLRRQEKHNGKILVEYTLVEYAKEANGDKNKKK